MASNGNKNQHHKTYFLVCVVVVVSEGVANELWVATVELTIAKVQLCGGAKNIFKQQQLFLSSNCQATSVVVSITRQTLTFKSR
jgi:hypothetical protein